MKCEGYSPVPIELGCNLTNLNKGSVEDRAGEVPVLQRRSFGTALGSPSRAAFLRTLHYLPAKLFRISRPLQSVEHLFLITGFSRLPDRGDHPIAQHNQNAESS
jgi:hypothetical protein